MIAAIRIVAEKIDPQRVDAIALSVGHVRCGLGLRQICNQGLRRVSGHQKRHIILIDEVAACARLQRECRRHRNVLPSVQ